MTLERMNLIAGVAFAALAASIVYAESHEAPSGWRYPSWCCSARLDCQQIPASAVRAGPHGYEIVLQPGEHKSVPEGFAFLVPYTATGGPRPQLRISPDDAFHACILPVNGYRAEPEPRCFFAPPPGS
jgi:hypothetical protein